MTELCADVLRARVSCGPRIATVQFCALSCDDEEQKPANTLYRILHWYDKVADPRRVGCCFRLADFRPRGSVAMGAGARWVTDKRHMCVTGTFAVK